jgi:hypothetical protein
MSDSRTPKAISAPSAPNAQEVRRGWKELHNEVVCVFASPNVMGGQIKEHGMVTVVCL